MDLTVVSYDGNSLNTADYTTYMPFEGGPLNLAPAEIREVSRLYRSPVLGSVSRTSRAITLWIRTDPVLSHSKRDSLMKIFDPYDISGGLKKLLAQDEIAKQWYVMGYPREVNRTEEGYEVILHVPDPEWIEETESSDTWNITASGQTRNITPAGNRPTYPIFEITPTATKTGTYSYKQLVIIRNVLKRALSKYPIDITNGGWDTATLTTAKMQADGDDLRVRVDGKEVDRWLDGMDTASTKVWINLDLPARAQGNLRAAIDADDTTLDLKSVDGHFPEDGCLIAESEAIRYSSHEKVVVSGKEYQRFSGLKRGALGTTAATHVAGTTVYRLPHVIYVVYGKSDATAPDIEDEDRPAFNMSTSSNTIWDFDDFNDDDKARAAGWREIVSGVLEKYQTIDAYTGTGGNDADPWANLGLIVKKKNPPAPGDHHSFWEFRSQVGISYGDMGGQHKEDHASDHLYLRLMDKVPDRNWREVWEQDLTNVTNSYWSWCQFSWLPRQDANQLRIGVYAVTEGDAAGNCYAEITDVTLRLDSSDTPYINFGLGGEQGSQYSLDCIITNNLTDEAINLEFVMTVGQTLTVDCGEKTVIYEADDSYQYQAFSRDSVRSEWMTLDPGVANALQFDETGLVAVTLLTYWRDRNS